jgi:hypothetical protein
MLFRSVIIPAMLTSLLVGQSTKVNKVIVGTNCVAEIQCFITKVKVKAVTEEERSLHPGSPTNRTFLYGSVLVKNPSSEMVVIDLRNISLGSGEFKTDGIYIDSVASILILPVRVPPGGEYKANVYWTVPNEMDCGMIDSLRLAFKAPK